MEQAEAQIGGDGGACTVGQLITGAYLTLNYFVEPPNEVVAMWPAKHGMHSESRSWTHESVSQSIWL